MFIHSRRSVKSSRGGPLHSVTDGQNCKSPRSPRRRRRRKSAAFFGRNHGALFAASQITGSRHGPGTHEPMSLLLLLGPIKTLLVAAAVFVPFERLAAANRTQRLFRRGWATDLFTGVANGLVLYAALLIVLGAADAAAAGLAPALRARVHAAPLWAQSLLAIAVGDLGIYASHRLCHAVPW